MNAPGDTTEGREPDVDELVHFTIAVPRHVARDLRENVFGVRPASEGWSREVYQQIGEALYG